MDIKERLKEHDAVEKSHNLYERNELAKNILESLRTALGGALLCQIAEAPDRVVAALTTDEELRSSTQYDLYINARHCGSYNNATRYFKNNIVEYAGASSGGPYNA
jgi:hypothetical protein